MQVIIIGAWEDRGRESRGRGITVNLRAAFKQWADALAPGEWDGLMAARRWFRGGGRLWRFWRHGIYQLLWPCRYEELRLQCEEAERQRKRALMAAVMNEAARVALPWQNWRNN